MSSSSYAFSQVWKKRNTEKQIQFGRRFLCRRKCVFVFEFQKRIFEQKNVFLFTKLSECGVKILPKVNLVFVKLKIWVQNNRQKRQRLSET